MLCCTVAFSFMKIHFYYLSFKSVFVFFKNFVKYILILLFSLPQPLAVHFPHPNTTNSIFLLFSKLSKESSLCWLTTPEHAWCPEIWSIYSVTTHRKNWFSSLSIYLANDFLVGAEFVNTSSSTWFFFFCWHELLHVLCMLSEVCEITGNLMLYLETTCSMNSSATSDFTVVPLSPLHRSSSLGGTGVI